jgi:hypothetical protein
MYKLFDFIYSKNTMFIDYINNKCGLDIYFIDRSNNTNYASFGGNESEPDDSRSMNGNGQSRENSSPTPPPSPVNLDKIPRKVDISEYTSQTENEDDSEGIEEDDALVADYNDKNDDALKEHRSNKRSKLDTSDTNKNKATSPDPDFDEAAHIVSKIKEQKNTYRDDMKDSAEDLNSSVDDLEEKLKSAKIINKEKTDYSRINNILNNDSSTSRKRTYDSMNESDDGYSADTEKQACFKDKETKEEFLADLARAQRHKNNLNRTAKSYNKLKSKLDEARIRTEEKRTNCPMTNYDAMQDNLPDIGNSNNGPKNK